MTLRRKLRLPKEHGAWGMLYVPMLAGVLEAGRWNGWLALLLVSATLLFVGRESLVQWWRARRWKRNPEDSLRYAAVYLSLAAAAGAPLIFLGGYWILAPMGALGLLSLGIHAEQSAERQERSFAGEILAVAALTLTAPAACYVSLGWWEWSAAGLWAACIAYFTSGVFYVKMRVLRLHGKSEQARRGIRRACLAYHGILLAGLLAAAASTVATPWILAAYAPVLARASWHAVRSPAPLDLRRVGWAEVVYSLIFAVLLPPAI